MRRVVPLVMGMAVTGLVLSPLAIAKVSKENVRAVNAARMRAEAVNGGLSNYRAAKCMYATGQGGGDCLKSDSDGFFKGVALPYVVYVCSQDESQETNAQSLEGQKSNF